jgi:uncharacterized protein (TIGR02001 family)
VARAPVPARSPPTERRRFRDDVAALGRAALIGVVVFSAAHATAQVSGSISAVSNYRYRGVSLSHNDPAAQATVVYDDPQGWYAGAFASTVRIGYPTANEAQGIFFAGYAHTMPFGAAFEAGIVYTGFTGTPSYAYPEIMLGAAYDKVNARVHYSPNYYGRGADAFYGELNAAHRLYEHVQAVAHVGALWTRARNIYGNAVDTVYDGRAGVVFDFERFSAQLSWVGISNANAGYGLTGVRSRNGPVISVSWLF